MRTRNLRQARSEASAYTERELFGLPVPAAFRPDRAPNPRLRKHHLVIAGDLRCPPPDEYG